MTEGDVCETKAMSLSPLNSAALLILQPQRQSSSAGSAADALVASVNRVGAPGAGSPLVQAQGKINDSMFSVNNVDATEMKTRLLERVGKEFGIDQKDYDSLSSYGAAVKNAVDALLRKSPFAASEIEKKLGLDKLGVTLQNVVNAMIDPGGSDDDKLDAALKRQLGEPDKGKNASARFDELGRYGG